MCCHSKCEAWLRPLVCSQRQLDAVQEHCTSTLHHTFATGLHVYTGQAADTHQVQQAAWGCLSPDPQPCTGPQLTNVSAQGEPGFERLKRELEELKNAPRGLEGTYRTAAEMERHRAQAADAAIEEQLEVQTAFREHGAKLQSIYEVKQRTESEMSRREQEMKQLSSESLAVCGAAVGLVSCVLDEAARPQEARSIGSLCTHAAACIMAVAVLASHLQCPAPCQACS